MNAEMGARFGARFGAKRLLAQRADGTVGIAGQYSVQRTAAADCGQNGNEWDCGAASLHGMVQQNPSDCLQYGTQRSTDSFRSVSRHEVASVRSQRRPSAGLQRGRTAVCTRCTREMRPPKKTPPRCVAAYSVAPGQRYRLEQPRRGRVRAVVRYRHARYITDVCSAYAPVAWLCSPWLPK
jgi:hypothetical protein